MDVLTHTQITRGRAIRLIRQAAPQYRVYREKLHWYSKRGLFNWKNAGGRTSVMCSMQDVVILSTLGRLLDSGLEYKPARRVLEWLREHLVELLNHHGDELYLAVTDKGDAAWLDVGDPLGPRGVSVLDRPGQRYLLPTKKVTLRLIELAKEEGLLEAA